jgi:hypothetical protein
MYCNTISLEAQKMKMKNGHWGKKAKNLSIQIRGTKKLQVREYAQIQEEHLYHDKEV